PDRNRIIRCDKAERLQSCPRHAFGDQHPEGLVRVPPLEGEADHILVALVRESLDQQLARAWEYRSARLHFEPEADIFGKALPACGVREEIAHPVRQPGGYGQPRAHIGWDARRS